MYSPRRKDIPPPDRWEDFEDLCLRLWKRILEDPNTTKHGRGGQRQSGVDIYGTDSETGSKCGIQCKQRSGYPNSKLTPEEIQEEVVKANAFAPSLDTLIVASTTKRDAKLQQVARELSEQNAEHGLFKVELYSWNDIVEWIYEFPDILAEYISIEVPAASLDKWTIDDEAREILVEDFVQPREYEDAKALLIRHRIACIVGPHGVGKQSLAAHLSLTCFGDSTAYRVPRTIGWQSIFAAKPSDGILIMPNFLGDAGYEGVSVLEDLKYIQSILEHGNCIILTSAEEVLAEADHEARYLDSFLATLGSPPVRIAISSYGFRGNALLLNKALRRSLSDSRISRNQFEWMQDILGDSPPHDVAQRAKVALNDLLANSWLPIDIVRFVRASLGEVSREEEIISTLKGETDLEQRCRIWFHELDDSTKVFVFVLTIFRGSRSSEFWLRYCEIVKALQKLDWSLKTLPLGMLRYRAEPYVSQKEALDFESAQIYRIMIKTVAREYLEYVIELLETLIDWSLPPNREKADDEEFRQLLSKTEGTRNAIARLIAETAKHALAEVLPAFETWGADSSLHIRKTVGITLREMMADPIAAQSALELIAKWANDFKSKNCELYRASAGSSLWRILHAAASEEIKAFVLDHIGFLARDPKERVAAAACNSVKISSRAGRLRFTEVKSVLSRLAARSFSHTRTEAVDSLMHLCRRNISTATGTIERWLVSNKKNLIWSALYAISKYESLRRELDLSLVLDAATRRPLVFWKAIRDFSCELEIDIDAMLVELTLANLKDGRSVLADALADLLGSGGGKAEDVCALLLASRDSALTQLPVAAETRLATRRFVGSLHANPREALAVACRLVWKSGETFDPAALLFLLESLAVDEKAQALKVFSSLYRDDVYRFEDVLARLRKRQLLSLDAFAEEIENSIEQRLHSELLGVIEIGGSIADFLNPLITAGKESAIRRFLCALNRVVASDGAAGFINYAAQCKGRDDQALEMAFRYCQSSEFAVLRALPGKVAIEREAELLRQGIVTRAFDPPATLMAASKSSLEVLFDRLSPTEMLVLESETWKSYVRRSSRARDYLKRVDRLQSSRARQYSKRITKKTRMRTVSFCILIMATVLLFGLLLYFI